jgi:ribosomal protein S4
LLRCARRAARSRSSPRRRKSIARRGCPAWLESDGAAFKGVVKALPTREDIQFPINEQLIVELYSK